jgi:hypothetical protein
VQRAEFVQQYPEGMTPELFVDGLNYNAGGVLASADRDALVQGLKNGAETRSTVLIKTADSESLRQREYNNAFVLMQYFAYLRRDADGPGLDFWLNILNHNPTNFRGMVCAFVTSREYQLRFGSVVMHNDTECGG